MITAHRAPIRGRARPRRRCKCEEETLAISGILFYNFLPAAICFRSSFRVRLAVLKSGPRNLKARDLLNAFLENTFPAVLKRGRLTVPISGPKNVRRIRKSQIPNQNFSHKASTCLLPPRACRLHARNAASNHRSSTRWDSQSNARSNARYATGIWKSLVNNNTTCFCQLPPDIAQHHFCYTRKSLIVNQNHINRC